MPRMHGNREGLGAEGGEALRLWEPEGFPLVRTGDGSLTLYHPGYRDPYRSLGGAAQEARQVFLAGSEVLKPGGSPTRTLLEIGLGTAWNLAITLDQWYRLRQDPAFPQELHYIAVEEHPLPVAVLERLNHRAFMEVPELWDAFLPLYASLLPRGGSGEVVPGWRFTLMVGDALQVSLPGPLHAIYLDPFREEANPRPWQYEFLKALYERLCEGGTLTTYASNTRLRRNLERCGFSWERKKAPPPKREFLRARKGGASLLKPSPEPGSFSKEGRKAPFVPPPFPAPLPSQEASEGLS